MRKVRWRLLPLLFLLGVVAVLDRTNIGLAALQMNRDLGLSATAFGVGAGIFALHDRYPAGGTDRARCRLAFLAACGLIVAATVKQPTVAFLALAATVIGVNAFLPAFWCLTSAVGGGAVGIALVSSVGNVGGFIGPSALGAVKTGTGSFTGGLLGLGVLILGAAGMTLGLRRWPPVRRVQDLTSHRWA